jgi:hypothetical protein
MPTPLNTRKSILLKATRSPRVTPKQLLEAERRLEELYRLEGQQSGPSAELQRLLEAK